jgi:hypothetical protein
MVHMPLDAPITRRELYFELTLVWLFVVLVAVQAMPEDVTWTSLLLPIGGLLILLAHVWALRPRSQR